MNLSTSSYKRSFTKDQYSHDELALGENCEWTKNYTINSRTCLTATGSMLYLCLLTSTFDGAYAIVKLGIACIGAISPLVGTLTCCMH